MSGITFKQSSRFQLTNYAGFAIVGECFKASQLDLIIDPKIPVSQGMKTSDLLKSTIALLTIGKSDFEAIETFRQNDFFKEALGIKKVPSSAWMRQRLNDKAPELLPYCDELSLRLLTRTQAPITPHLGYVCLDIDTFVMNNDNSKKEQVSRTYQGVDGYTPIAAYLGNEGWNIGLELRKGSDHSAKNSEQFFNKVFLSTQRLIAGKAQVLLRVDSGFDAVALLMSAQQEKERYSLQEQSFDYIFKWNPRQQDKQAILNDAIQAGSMTASREGKRQGWIEHQVVKTIGNKTHTFRLVVRVTERTIDKKGQVLIMPEITLDGWYTSLKEDGESIAQLYRHHGTHEQYHSEIKSDLDLERLPSGKFDTNDLIVHLGAFAYNCLRLIGQLGLTGKISPVRHPAKRRRIKTVLQEIMYRAAKVIKQARRFVLDFGRHAVDTLNVFNHIHAQLRRSCVP